MKQIKTLVITAISALLVLSSCSNFNSNQNDNYMMNSGTILLSNPIPEEVTGTHPFYIVTDDSLVFIPQNTLQYTDGTKYDPKDGNRIIFYYQDIPTAAETRVTTTGKKYKMISLAQLGDIKTSEMVRLDPDKLVNDRVEPLLVWYCGGVFNTKRYVTIKFSYLGYNLKEFPHDNYLVIDSTEENHIEDGYFKVTFRHDPKKDHTAYTYTGFASFEIPEECTAEGIKGLMISFNSPAEGKRDFKVKY